MSIQKRGFLLGMLLGDGCLKAKQHKDSIYYEYVLCHSTKQEVYLTYKRDLFHSIIGGKLPKIHYETTSLGYRACRFSRAHRKFRIYHKILYSKDNKKYFSDKVFRYLTPQSIAIWYMDDGCITYNPSGKSFEMRLYTYFSEMEADRAIQYFKDTFEINVKKRHYMKRDQWNLIFNTTESKKLTEVIKDYIIPEMQYKLPNPTFTRALDTTKQGSDDIV